MSLTGLPGLAGSNSEILPPNIWPVTQRAGMNRLAKALSIKNDCLHPQFSKMSIRCELKKKLDEPLIILSFTPLHGAIVFIKYVLTNEKSLFLEDK